MRPLFLARRLSRFSCLAAALLGLFAARAGAVGFSTLHSFTEGSIPDGQLALDGQVIYGVTQAGSAAPSATAAGTLYRIDTDGSGFRTLRTFDGADGRTPIGGPIVSGGVIYGTTFLGGTGSVGTVYRANTDGSGFATIHHFPLDAGPDNNPGTTLVHAQGALYGTTTGGNNSNQASAIFRLSPAGGGYTRVRTLSSLTDPLWPLGNPLLDGSTLYGTTFYGGLAGQSSLFDTRGTVYRVNLDGSGFSVLHRFAAGEGANPQGSLARVGSALYGTTNRGGTQNVGTIFRVNVDGTGFATLRSFLDGADGGRPQSGLTAVGGVLFGTTAPAGVGSGPGTLFKINPDGTGYAVIHAFAGGPGGGSPASGMVHRDGVLYGTTMTGGAAGRGTIFQFDLRPTLSAPATLSAYAGFPVSFSASAVSPAGFASSYEIVSGPAHGTLSAAGGTFTYTPAARYAGPDSIVLRARHDAAASAPATIAVTVLPAYVPGLYAGALSGGAGGTFALLARPDRTGTLLVHLGANRGLLAPVAFDEDGFFTATSRELAPPGAAGPVIDGRVGAATLQATIAGGGTLAATVAPADAALAGSYAVRALGATPAEVYFIVGNASTYVVLVRDSAVEAATGPALVGNLLSVPLVGGAVSATLDPAGTVNGTLFLTAGGSLPLGGLSDTVAPVRRLANISTRGVVGTGDAILIAGFVLQGSAPKPLLIRAAGPALGQFGLTATVARPRLELFLGQVPLFANAGWSNAANAPALAATADAVGAFAFAAGSADSALLATLNPANYTAIVTAEAGATGVALVEVFDTPGDDARLLNLSTRGFVGTGDQTLIVGFVVRGNAPKPLLLRAAGPALGALGVPGAIANPRLELRQGQAVLAANDDWDASPRAVAAASSAGAFAFQPGSTDAALVVTLAPGNYTMLVQSAAGSGVALAEIYELP